MSALTSESDWSATVPVAVARAMADASEDACAPSLTPSGSDFMYNPAVFSRLNFGDKQMLNRRVLALGLIATLLCLPLFAQSQSDKDLLERIRKEERDNSQLMKTEHMLTDVYGPRLTGSPNHKAAAEWAIKQMTAWGLSNAHLEPWDFGHVGWLNERFT